MEQVTQDEDLRTETFMHEDAKRERIMRPQDAYQIIDAFLTSSEEEGNYDDEADTLDSGFSSAHSFAEETVPIKADGPSASPLPKDLPGAKAIRTPTIFAPRSPKNYQKKPIRKTKSADFVLLGASDHRGLSSSISRSESKWSDAFDSPKYTSKSGLMAPKSDRSLGTIQFPSPFSTPLSFRDFNAANKVNVEGESTGQTRTTRSISEGDAGDPYLTFQQSMDLGDIFPSVFDDTPFGPSNRSMPDLRSPGLLDSSLIGQGGDGSSRGSIFDYAMEIDPFDDDCVKFDQNDVGSPMIHSPTTQTNSVDLVQQMQDLKKKHEQEVNKLKRELDTGNRIISSLTKQVQELMARNETLSFQNKKAKESIRDYQQQRAARIDMMGNVIESPDASPSLRQRHTTADGNAIKELSLDDGETGKKKRTKGKPKRKSSHKRKTKKANRTPITTEGSMSTHDTMSLEDPDQPSSKRSSKGSPSTSGRKNKRKNNRSVSNRSMKQLSISSLETDEHPLSHAKRQKSMAARSLKNSIASIEKENNESTSKRMTPRSSKTMSETLESIWSFEWKDPNKAEVKRETQKKKQPKVPKKPKSKRNKTVTKSKAKQQATSTDEAVEQNVTKSPVRSPVKKSKKIGWGSFAAVGRLLSPKRTKTQLPTIVDDDDDTNTAQKPQAVPDL